MSSVPRYDCKTIADSQGRTQHYQQRRSEYKFVVSSTIRCGELRQRVRVQSEDKAEVMICISYACDTQTRLESDGEQEYKKGTSLDHLDTHGNESTNYPNMATFTGFVALLSGADTTAEFDDEPVKNNQSISIISVLLSEISRM